MKKQRKWLAPVAFLALVAITVLVVAGQSKTFTAEGFLEYIGTVKPWGLAAAVGCTLLYVLFEGQALLVLCRALGYRPRAYRGVLYSAADIYFSAITPSATGGQPASALLMMGDGIPGAMSTVILLLNLAMYNLALMGASLAGLLLWPGVLGAFDTPAHLLIALGAGLHLALIAGIFLLVLSDKLFLKVINLFLHLGQKLHILKNAEARREKLMEIENDYRACAGELAHRKIALFHALLLNIGQRVATTLVPVVLYVAAGGPARDMGRMFSIQIMAVLGSNSVPIPGAVGVADYLFLNGYGALIEDPTNLEMLSRTITFYSCVLLCGLILLGSFFLKKHQGSETE